MQESGSEEECSEESSSSPEEDAEFSANEEDGKINPSFIIQRKKIVFCKCVFSSRQPVCIYNSNDRGMNSFCPLFKLRMRRTPLLHRRRWKEMLTMQKNWMTWPKRVD